MSYTLPCQNPACGRTFESRVPWAKYCPLPECQKYHINTRSHAYWKRKNPPHPCKGGCGTLLTGKWLWCDKPECRKKQADQYQAERQEYRKKYPNKPVKQVVTEERLAKVTLSLVDSGERKHNRKCVDCGRPCWPNYFRCKRCSKPVDIVEEWLHAGFGHDFRRTGFKRGGAI